MNINISYRRRNEVLTLIKYLLLTAIAAVPTVFVIGQAWNQTPWGLPLQAITAVHHELGVNLLVPYFFLLGIFLAPMVLLLLDRYHRMHGLIAWVGLILVSVLVLIPQGLLINQLLDNITLWGIAAFVLGFIPGLYLSGFSHKMLQNPEIEFSFPRAPKTLFILTSVIVVAGLVETFLVYHSPIYISGGQAAIRPFELIGFQFDVWFIGGIISGAVLLYGLKEFLGYESSARTIQIGPQRSGKTASFAGLYQWIDQINPGALLEGGSGARASEQIANQVENGEFPSTTEMEEMSPLNVSYETDGWFKEELELQGVDYPGESLESVLQPILNTRDRKITTDGGQIDEDSLQSEESDNLPDAPPDVQPEPDVSPDISSEESDAPPEGITSPSTVTDTDHLGYGEATGWDSAIQNVKSVVAEKDNKSLPAAVWNCVLHADRVILTIPFDDFIGPIIERGNQMSYKRIEKTDDRSEIDEERTILCEVDGTIYYDPDRPDRPEPREYLGWYVNLCQEYPDKEYIVAVTKADLAINDFEEQSNYGSDPYYDISEFREHIIDIMSSVETRTSRLIEKTHEKKPFALWYNIKDESPPAESEQKETGENLTIDTDVQSGPILRGVEQLLERLER